MRRLIPLLPAPSPANEGQDGADENANQRRDNSKPPRRAMIRNACLACKRKKVKCDGQVPICSPCNLRGEDCKYDVSRANLRSEAHRLRDKTGHLEQLFNALREGTDEEAIQVLSAIRVGAGLEGVMSQLQSRQNIASNHRPSQSNQGSNNPPGSLTVTLNPPTVLPIASHQTFLTLLFDRDEWKLKAVPNEGPSSLGVKREVSIATSFEVTEGKCLQQVLPMDSTKQPLLGGLKNMARPKMASHAILSDNVWNFGNLPFSSSVKANHYPPDIQARQVENIHVPTWAMMPMNTLAGASSVKDSVSVIYQEAKAMISSGVPADVVTGTDCNVAAIFDRNEYEKTSMLSQWAARIIYSVRHKSNDFTSLAACYLMWVLMRWMVNPRPDTYQDIPEWYRPTPYQLFMPHVELIDFLNWPALRDKLISTPAMQGDLMWLMDMSLTICCHWEESFSQAMKRDLISGDRVLTTEAKGRTMDLNNWSVGPSFRMFVSGADHYVKIQSDHPLY